MTMTVREVDMPADDEGEIAPAPDRRSAQRLMTTLRIGKLVCAGAEELCLIRNISEGGLMLRVYSRRWPGERVTIELKSDQCVAGAVLWAKEDMVGIRFDQPVDVNQVLRNERNPVGHRPRSPRLTAQSRARLRIGDENSAAELCDLSQGGAKIRVEQTLTVGDEVILTINGMRPIRSVVRWQVREHAGVAFVAAIPLGELVSWMNARRPRASGETTTA